MKKLLSFFFLIIIYIFVGCGPTPDCNNIYYVKPSDWRSKENRDSTIKYYGKFYNGWKIFIDPGHGGEDRRNQGPKKQAIEADLNLYIGLILRDYLEQAGATVFMSRDIDKSVGLEERSRMANQSGADIFISIHHNAPGKSGDIYTNFTSTYYHATASDSEFEPSNQDIAKYIQRDLAYVMGNSGGLGSFDGTYSDYWIYPKMGFAVLRNTKIPGILLECSFFTSEYEEQRLINKEFNEIQAWGIFRGLGKYIRNGVVRLSSSQKPVYSKFADKIIVKIDDKNKGIDTTFSKIMIDQKPVNYSFKFTDTEKFIEINIKNELSVGNHELSILIKNVNGNHSFPFKQSFEIINQR